jgi:hypothetical protein
VRIGVALVLGDELTVFEDGLELGGGDDGQAVGDDGVGGGVVLLVDENLDGGGHVFGWLLECRVCKVESVSGAG